MISVHELHAKCDMCHKRFRDQVLVRNHKLRVHKIKIHFKCVLCDFTHSYGKPVENHYKESHGRLEDLNAINQKCYIQMEVKIEPEPSKEIKPEVIEIDQVGDRKVCSYFYIICSNNT